MDDNTNPPKPQPTPPVEAPPEVAAETLFGEHREIVLIHEGERYRLRITRRGKLILQK